jgi:hypothetical protein
LLRFQDVAKLAISSTELHTCDYRHTKHTREHRIKRTAEIRHDPGTRMPSFLSKRGGTSLYIAAELLKTLVEECARRCFISPVISHVPVIRAIFVDANGDTPNILRCCCVMQKCNNRACK